MRGRIELVCIAALAAAFAYGCGEDGTAGVAPDGAGTSRPEGCFGKCDGTQVVFATNYEANLDAINAQWPNEKFKVTEVADAFSLLVDLGGVKLKSPTHMFGADVVVIPYGDKDDVKDAAGNTVERRDVEIAKAFPAGTVGIGLKHHRPQYRTFSQADASGDMKEHFKHQDTHIELVVGVERDGVPGAITLNNPQTYQDGLFGSPDYPVIFLKASMPEYVEPSLHTAYNDNILNWLMIFAAVSEFPGDYNGGDPLATYNSEKVLEHAVMGLKAITGDEAAQAWFKKDENLIYCAELAFVSHNAGVLIPLTKEFMSQYVSDETWLAYVKEVDAHNAGEPSAFTKLNENDKVALVRTTPTESNLAPIWKHAPADQIDAEKAKMAFQPMTAAHIVEHFLRLTFPRETMGEQIAPAQGGMLAKMKDGLLEQMGMDRLSAEDPKRMAVEALYGTIVEVVSKSYADYDTFRATVEPYLQQASAITGPRGESGEGFYVPPSLYHMVGQGKHNGGLLGVSYIGHGLHWTMVQPKSAPTPDPVEPTPDPPAPTPDPMIEEPLAGSCQVSCTGEAASGGCFCDQVCQEYGDCCPDYDLYCQQ